MTSIIGDVTTDMEISIDTTGNKYGKHVIKQIDFTPSKNKNNVRLEVADLLTEPENIINQVPLENNSVIYQYLDVKLLSDEEYLGETGIDSMTFVFSIEKSWFENNSINKQTIQMMRYHNDTWNELNTTYYFETSSEVYYLAETPGLSVFAVVGDQAEQQEQAFTPSTLYILCLFTLAILLVVSIINKKNAIINN